MKTYYVLFFACVLSGCSFVENVKNTRNQLLAAKAVYMEACLKESARCSGTSGWRDSSCTNFITDSRGRRCDEMWRMQYK